MPMGVVPQGRSLTPAGLGDATVRARKLQGRGRRADRKNPRIERGQVGVHAATRAGLPAYANDHFLRYIKFIPPQRRDEMSPKAIDAPDFNPYTLLHEANVTMSYQFDEMISAPCRLGILATLVPGLPVSFTEMKSATSLSDGNLHVQTRKLADVGYIEISKNKKGKRTVTRFRITELGRERLRLYVMKLQKILDAEVAVRRPARRVQRPDDSAVWA
jgi:DNA-binding MarR family transcriptional regulator